MIRVKICGITSVADALCCAENGADAIGLVFAKSRRQIDPFTARKISAALPPFIGKVGVFVDMEREAVKYIASDCGLTALQFHGSENADYCRGFSLPVLKVVRMRCNVDLESFSAYSVAAFVLDTFHPTLAGGSGVPFDWKLIKTRLPKPMILAGGLNSLNVEQAIDELKPYAVDVSSGVETNGEKDKTKIKAFINAVRRCH